MYCQKINLCNSKNCSQINNILYLQNLLLLNDHFTVSDYSFFEFIEDSGNDKYYPAKQKLRCLIMLLLMLSGNVQPNPGPVLGLLNNLQSVATPSDFKSRHGLGFIHLNVRSLVPKMDMIRIWANTTNADIIVISETWLKKSVTKIPKVNPRMILKRHFKSFEQQAFLHDLYHSELSRVSLFSDV